MKAAPCPLSRAIARRPPAISTRCRFAPSKKSWPTSAILTERRETILASIAEQGKLTDELKARIEATLDKSELEDLYLPYQAQAADQSHHRARKGAGAAGAYLWAQEACGEPLETFAATFVNAEQGVATAGGGARRRAAHRGRMDQRRCRPAQGTAPTDVRRGRGRQPQGRWTRWTSRKSSRCTTSTASR